MTPAVKEQLRAAIDAERVPIPHDGWALVDVPIPTSTNRLYRNTVNRKTFKRGKALTREHLNWRKTIGNHLMKARAPRFKGDWLVEIVLPRSCRKDASNVVKATEDALVHFGVVIDDYRAEGSFGRHADISLHRGGCMVIVRSVRAASQEQGGQG